jgi:hypothetical protein
MSILLGPFFAFAAFLTFSSSTSVVFAQDAAVSVPKPAVSSTDVDTLATELSNRFEPIRRGPVLFGIPLSYRLAAVCNTQVKQTLDNYFFKSFSATGSVVLIKPEQLPPKLRLVADCPKCRREAVYKNRLNQSFGNWLRESPKSFREKVVTFCETRV